MLLAINKNIRELLKHQVKKKSRISKNELVSSLMLCQQIQLVASKILQILKSKT